MAENETMEGKDLALEELKQFNKQVLEAIDKLGTLKVGESATILGEIHITKSVGKHAILAIKGKNIAIINGKSIQYNLANYQEVKKALEEDGQTLEDLGLPDLEEAIAKIQTQNKEKEEKREETENEQEEEQQEESDDEVVDEEKDDEKPDLEEDKDPKKEEIAKKYNLNARDVVHISNDERVTENEKFKDIVVGTGEYDDIYILLEKDKYSCKFVGSKNGNIEEIQVGTNKVIGGREPDVTIKRIDEEGIPEIRPLAMYEIDNDTAIAIVKDEHGYTQAIYCRQQEGNEKEYWGSLIPEESGKNVDQESPEVRSFMDYRNNSGLDLDRKEEELDRKKSLAERGAPIEINADSINGSTEQNREADIEKIAEELMRRDGILDRATVPPGYYEHKAEKVVELMENNKEEIEYEEAIEKVETESKGNREPGGTTQGEKLDRRG